MTYIFGDLGRSWSFFMGFGEQRQNTFREPRQLFSGIWGDQCIIFRDQGSTDPPWGPRESSPEKTDFDYTKDTKYCITTTKQEQTQKIHKQGEQRREMNQQHKHHLRTYSS